MRTTKIAPLTKDELIRLLMTLDDMRGSWKLGVAQTELHVGTTTYPIAPHIILDLIDNGWLIQVGKGDTYELDHDREDEWLTDEKVRTDEARNVLADRYPAKMFRDIGWTILHHPESMDQDTRGFVFEDADGYGYCVCPAGRVLHILTGIDDVKEAPHGRQKNN